MKTCSEFQNGFGGEITIIKIAIDCIIISYEFWLLLKKWL